MAAFVLPVVPPRTGGGGGGAAAASSPPRRRRHPRPRPLPVVAVAVPVVRAAAAAAAFEPDPLLERGGGGGGGGGSGACVRGPDAPAAVGGGAWERGLSTADAETVGTSRLSATTYGSSPQPQPQSRAGAGGGAAQAAAAATTEDLRGVASGDGDAVANAGSAAADDDAVPDEGDDDGKGGSSAWSGRKHTASARAKISAANRGRVPWNKGRQHSEETRARIAAATRAAMNRPEVRNRMADKNEGRKHSPETRAKIRASCTARFLSSRKSRQAVAVTAGDGVPGGSAHDKDAPAGVPASAKASSPDALVRTAAVGLQQLPGVAEPLPFSYDNAVLGPQVLAALPRLALGEDGSDAAGGACDGAWVTGGGSGAGADGIDGACASFSSKRGPLSAETRAKLSRRIRDMWANDPGYRARVTAGIASRSTGKVRQLSKQHREAIRQSLLSRNAQLRQRGLAHPSTRYADGQGPLRRRRRSGADGAHARPPRTPEEQAARAEARQLKRQEREERRALRRAAREEEEAARRQSQKALVSQLVSAGSLPSLESLAQLDSWSGVPVEERGDDAGAAASGGGGDAHGARATPADDDDAPDFDAIRAAGASLQGRLRGTPDGGGEERGGHGRDREELIGLAAATMADDGSGVPDLAGGAPVDLLDGDAGLPPEVALERIDYGDQLSFDLVSSPAMPGAADVLAAAADDGADDLLPVAAADATDAEDEVVDSDSDDESDDDDDWDDDDDDDEDDDSDEEEEQEEGFDFSWEYEVEPTPRKPSTPVNIAPVRKRILTYVNGAATTVDSTA